MVLMIVGVAVAIGSLVVMIMGVLRMERATRSLEWQRGRTILTAGAVTLVLFVTATGIVVVLTATSQGWF